jgi:hypothetical protein
LHNLRDFTRIGEIYGEVRAHLKPGGPFLNVDLVNAPSAGVQQRYVGAAAARRQREGAPAANVEAMAPQSRQASSAGPFPADLDRHLAALRAAGFKDVDGFWKDLGRALFGGYA